MKNNENVREMLYSIKKTVKDSGEKCSIASFDDFWRQKYVAYDTSFDHKAFLSDIVLLQKRNEISYYRELTSFRKGLSFIVLPIKKLIRKLAAFLFLPIIEEQNMINAANSRIAIHIRGYINRDQSEREHYAKKETELLNSVKNCAEETSYLYEKIELLTQRINYLEKKLSEEKRK